MLPSGIGGVHSLFSPKTIHVNLGVSTHRQPVNLFAQLFADMGIFPSVSVSLLTVLCSTLPSGEEC